MATRYGNVREVRNAERELQQISKIENDPYTFGSIQNKTEFYRRKEQVTSRVNRLKAPTPTDTQRKSLEKRNALLEEFIKGKADQIRKPAMPSKEEMWDAPAGSIGKHRAWQDRVSNYTVTEDGKPVRAKDGYGAASEWKDIQRQLVDVEEQEMDPDVASIERLRPDKRDHSSFSDYKRMSFAPGANVPQEVWDKTVGPKEEAVPQCQRLKKDGSACMASALPGRDCCSAHSKE